MNKQFRKKIFNSEVQNTSNVKYQFKLAWGSSPHPEKAWKGGQDAIYVSKNILIVADGVSGWSSVGIDSGIYARRLIDILRYMVESQDQLYFIERPKELAIRAVEKNEEKGSSTLTILTLHPHTGMMRSYHIGDSIFGVFQKNGKQILAEQQQTNFNVTFQVQAISNKNLLVKSCVNQIQHISDVFKGVYNQFTYQQTRQSAIVVASDGLWDNIHIEQIKKELFSPSNDDLLETAKILIKKIKYYNSLALYESPFYHKALRKGISVPKIGKIDDISIIIAQIISLRY